MTPRERREASLPRDPATQNADEAVSTSPADDVRGRAVEETARARAAEAAEENEAPPENAGRTDRGDMKTTILPDVAALSAERDEYLGALQRLKADFDNYRKRVARLQDEQVARVSGELVRKLLPVLDNLDLAIAHLGNGGSSEPTAGSSAQPRHVSEEARALEQARAQLLDVLSKEGLERVDAVEVPFDPTVHDAVAHAPAKEPVDGTVPPTGADETVRGEDPGTADDPSTITGTLSNGEAPVDGAPAVTAVDEVMRAGYRWRGQVLRPAMVRVRG